MNDFEWDAVRRYLDRHRNIVAEVVMDMCEGDLDKAVKGLKILLDPSRECVDTVDIEYYWRVK